MRKIVLFSVFFVIFISCKKKAVVYDASGTFEAVETTISAEVSGIILRINFQEGDSFAANKVAVSIDSSQNLYRKKQIEAQLTAAGYRIPNIKAQTGAYAKQIAVIQTRLNYLNNEQSRIQRMLQDDAATPKQLDDINAQIREAEKQIDVFKSQDIAQRSALNTQSASIKGEKGPLLAQIDQINDQLNRATIYNPISGIILARYVNPFELAVPGKPLYKIANLDSMILRAYFTSDMLTEVQVGAKVKVFAGSTNEKQRSYIGVVEWISSEAEFTPKTIQTRDERANLVYAVKIIVKNDGYLRLGMYGDVQLK